MTKGRERRAGSTPASVTIARTEGGRVTVELDTSSGDADQDRRTANTLFHSVLEQRNARPSTGASNALPTSAFAVWAYRDNN